MKWSLRLGRYGRKHAGSLVGVFALMSGSILFDLLKPWPLKLIVDNVMKGHPLPPRIQEWAKASDINSPEGLLFSFTAVTVIFFVMAWLLKVGQAFLQTIVSTTMTYELAGDLFRRLQRLSLAFHTRRQTGDLVRRVTADCTCVRDLLIGVVLPAGASLLTLIGMSSILWRLDHSLAVLTMAVAVPLGFSIRRYSKPMTEANARHCALQGETVGFANQVFAAMPLVRAFGRETVEGGRYEDWVERSDAAGLRATGSQLKFKLSVAAFTGVGMAGIIAVGGWHVLQGKLSMGGLLVFLSYVNSFYGPLETLAYLSSGWASAGARAQRVFEVLDSDDIVRESGHPKSLRIRAGEPVEVCFADVTFGYEARRPVLNEVSFKAGRGEKIAIVGRSGAGKSALISLIPRLVDPWEGVVRINGVDVREVLFVDLRANISFVLQDQFLLPLTVAENIAYGRPNATLEEIEAAAQAAFADEFIRRLPNSYQTVLGEGGATLSGGERQRLSIARAFLKGAPLLILDEATSSLDSESERFVLQGLERLSAGRTVFIVAHRLGTLRGADRILVLEEGRIAQSGSHCELVAQDGYYARLAGSLGAQTRNLQSVST